MASFNCPYSYYLIGCKRLRLFEPVKFSNKCILLDFFYPHSLFSSPAERQRWSPDPTKEVDVLPEGSAGLLAPRLRVPFQCFTQHVCAGGPQD